MVVSVAVSWYWFRATGERRWWWAVAMGVSVGMATSAKENGFLGVVGPTMLVLMLAARSGGRPLLERVGQAGVAVVTACAVFAALYLPIAKPGVAIRHLLAFQGTHDRAGHLVGYAGRATLHPDWWANLWWAGRGLGPLVVVATLLGATAALVLRRDRLVAWCLAALVGPAVFHLFLAKVALPYYYVMWLPFYMALAALGIGELARRALRPGSVPWRVVAVVLCCVALVLCLVAAVRGFVRMVTLPLTGPWALSQIMQEKHLSGPVLFGGFGVSEYDPNVPGGGTTKYQESLTAFNLIVISTPRCRNTIPPRILAGIDVNEKDDRLREVFTDKKMIVYAATAPLMNPTPAQTDAIPPHHPADGC